MIDYGRILGSAVTTFDRKQEERAKRSKRGYHNRYALGQYLMRVDEVVTDIDAGSTPRAAILAAFDDRIADACLVAIGEPKQAEGEHESVALFYVPASER